MFLAEKRGIGVDATFPSTIPPRFQSSQLKLEFRYPYVWAQLQEKAGVSQFSLGGGVTELG
jgi:hypothetical protein